MAENRNQNFIYTTTDSKDLEVDHLTENLSDASDDTSNKDVNYQDLMQKQGMRMPNYERILGALKSRAKETLNEDRERFKESSSVERMFKCDQCDSSFAMKHHLTQHMNIHTGLRPYKCDICNAAFVRRYALTRHKRTHMDLKPFKCDVCPAVFSLKHGLKQHLLIHSGVKEFECDVCFSSFSRKFSLDRHKKVHVKEWKMSEFQPEEKFSDQLTDGDVQSKNQLTNQIIQLDHK